MRANFDFYKADYLNKKFEIVAHYGPKWND